MTASFCRRLQGTSRVLAVDNLLPVLRLSATGKQKTSFQFRDAIDHFTYYCLGSQGGKLWVAMRLLGPIACRNTAEITENDQSVVLNRRLPVSTFSPTIGLVAAAPHWAEIDRLASGAERAREIKEKKQLAIADAGAVAAAAQSEDREELAEAGKQIEEHKKREEEMERLFASSNVTMPAQKLRSRILSFENVKGNDDQLRHSFLDCLSSSGKRLVLSKRRKSSAKSMLRTRKEAGRTWEVLVGWQWWPFTWRPAARDDPFEDIDQAQVAAARASIHFWCVGGWCVTHLSRSGLVSCTWGWDNFRRGYLGRMWWHPWQSASVRTTLTHLLSWMPQSCAPNS